MSHRHHHLDGELFAKWLGIFMLIGGSLFLITVTYGTILLPVAGGAWWYKRKTGHWPRLKKQQPARIVYKAETAGGQECHHKHTTPGHALECARQMERRIYKPSAPAGRR